MLEICKGEVNTDISADQMFNVKVINKTIWFKIYLWLSTNSVYDLPKEVQAI